LFGACGFSRPSSHKPLNPSQFLLYMHVIDICCSTTSLNASLRYANPMKLTVSCTVLIFLVTTTASFADAAFVPSRLTKTTHHLRVLLNDRSRRTIQNAQELYLHPPSSHQRRRRQQRRDIVISEKNYYADLFTQKILISKTRMSSMAENYPTSTAIGSTTMPVQSNQGVYQIKTEEQY